MAKPSTSQRLLVLAFTTIPLFLHILFAVGSVAFVLAFIDKHSFNIGFGETGGLRDIVERTPIKDPEGNAINFRFKLAQHAHLRQGDAVTILSVLLVITRTALGAWCTGVVWKSVFLLLELAGLTVRQISRVVSWKFLLPPITSIQHHPKDNRIRVYLILIALLIPFPAQLSTPLITGAITWTPTIELSNGTSLAVPVPQNGLDWSEYQENRNFRRAVVVDAARTSTLGWNNASIPLSSDIFKRELHEAVGRNLQNGSLIYDVKAPYLQLSNFRWITNLTTEPHLDPRVVESGSAWLNVSFIESPPLAYPGQGSVSLIMPTPWKSEIPTDKTYDVDPRDSDHRPSPVYTFPSPNIFNDTVYIAVFADWSRSNCSGSIGLPITPDWYGVEDPYDIGSDNEHERHCFIFAAVDILAGVTSYKSCPIESGRFASCQAAQMGELLSDPMVHEALWLVSEVTSTTLLMDEGALESFYNSVDLGEGSLPLSQLDTYVKSMLSRSYTAAWGSLAEYMDGDQQEFSGNVSVAIPMTEGVIYRPRVYTWFILQGMVWIAALLFWAAQLRCLRPMTNETIVAAIFMDTSEACDPRSTGLGDAIRLNSEHDKLGILGLEYNNGHSRLVRRGADDVTNREVLTKEAV